MRFALLGLAIGALYAIVAQGIVLIYRASGVVNFAQGGFVLVGGYLYYELHQSLGLGPVPSLVLVALAGVALGCGVHYGIMRPLRNASPVARVVATLGILGVLLAVATLRYGQNILGVDSIFPTGRLDIAGAIVTEDRVVLLGIGVVVTIVLWAGYRFTRFGKATTAVAENELAAASFGLSHDSIAARNWAIGSALAMLTGPLIAPILFLAPAQTSSIVLPAIAAALLGGFASFPLAFGAALAIGVGESVLTYQAAARDWWPGWAVSLPFLVVVVTLIVKGRGIPLRSHLFDRLPKVGSGRVRPVPVAVAIAVGAAGVVLLPYEWSIALTVTMCYAIVCLSVVLVTGYAGQLSLAQYTIGATGAFVGAKLMADLEMPFVVSFAAGVVAAVAIGALVGAPALRTRGLTLAVATLGIAASLHALLLTNIKVVDVVGGVPIVDQEIFGWSLDPDVHPERYGLVTLGALVLIALGMANLRRGAAGRRLLAVRSNERAALAMGISVYAAKLYAFMMSAGIAAVGVCALAFLNQNVLFSGYDVTSSIGFVTSTVVGGLGSVGGGIVGSTLISGGITSRLLMSLGDGLNAYLPLIGGLTVLLVLLTGADGIVEQNRAAAAAVGRRLRGRAATASPAAVEPGPPVAPPLSQQPSPTAHRVPATTLTVADLSVRFGGVTAVRDVCLTVRPGTVHGLIGPNGAGKTTFIDAVTGFVTAGSGTIRLGDTPIERLGAGRRSRLGLARSFQSGELFADLTVLENLAVACDDPSVSRWLGDLVRPGRIALSPAAALAAREFGLEEVYDAYPDDLPFGTRRMVAIARAVAAAPSVLLLDEPASGLDSSEADELGRLIRSLADDWGIGVLLVEHNLDMVLATCDEITVLSAGAELVSAAPPSVVRTHPAVVEAYVGVADEDEAVRQA